MTRTLTWSFSRRVKGQKISKSLPATRVDPNAIADEIGVDPLRYFVPRATIAGPYDPAALVGRTVVYLANLKAAKIRGVLSQGMILAAGDTDVLALAALDKEVPLGTKGSMSLGPDHPRRCRRDLVVALQ